MACGDVKSKTIYKKYNAYERQNIVSTNYKMKRVLKSKPTYDTYRRQDILQRVLKTKYNEDRYVTKERFWNKRNSNPYLIANSNPNLENSLPLFRLTKTKNTPHFQHSGLRHCACLSNRKKCAFCDTRTIIHRKGRL